MPPTFNRFFRLLYEDFYSQPTQTFAFSIALLSCPDIVVAAFFADQQKQQRTAWCFL